MLHGKYITDEGLEIVMAFLNVALSYCNNDFRFPVRSSTFFNRCKIAERVHDGLKRFVCCSCCHAIHPFTIEEEKLLSRGRKCGARGPFSYSQPCENDLFKRENRWKAKKLFYFNSPISTLRKFFLRDNFVDMIKKWKSRITIPDVLCDLQDGRVWKTFKLNENDATPFVLESEYNLMLSINVDWFQPFEYRPHSSGGIYMTIQNLPRELRNLRENLLLVGLMPGPKEPSTFHMNSYLKCLVDELLMLIPGVLIQTKYHGIQLVKAALTLVSCDLPAARKLVGFTSATSMNACHKCNKQFERLDEDRRINFSDFNYESWNLKTKADHDKYAFEWLQSTNEAQRKMLEKLNGTRWSELLRLPYFDAPRFTVFDVLHGFHIGTSKRMMSTMWRGLDKFVPGHNGPILTNQHLKEMEEAGETLILPFGYEDSKSINTKITSGNGFAYMKGAEWKTWAVAMSPYLLSQRLEQPYFTNWLVFVEILRIIDSPCISLDDIEKMHILLRKFMDGFVSAYKDISFLVPNMHFNMHMKDILLDYGPSHGHWTYGFERYNGDIKNIVTNQKNSIEHTFTKSFLRFIHGGDYFDTLPVIINDNAVDVKRLFLGVDIHGYKDVSLYNIDEYKDSLNSFDINQYLLFQNGISFSFGFEQLHSSTIKSMKFSKPFSLSADYFLILLEYYNFLYDNQNFIGSSYLDFESNDGEEENDTTTVANSCWKFNSIDIFGDTYKSLDSNVSRARGSYISAWYGLDKETWYLRPAQIVLFFRHQVDVLGAIADDEDTTELNNITHTFAYVK